MTYQVVMGAPGYLGWRTLMRTKDIQQSIIARETAVQRSHAYFREKMPTIASAEDLVSDYRLLKVALESAGLENDINNRFFIRKVLESDPDDRNSLANRLSDKRYAQLARSFKFGAGTAAPTDGVTIDDIIRRHVSAEFETRVGQTDADMRLALYAQRELAAIAGNRSTPRTKWFQIIGSPPLRKVVEGAFGFGSAYAKLPIDRQVTEFSNAAEKILGTADPTAMSSAENLDKLIQRFLLRAQSRSSVPSGFAIALALLSS